jgi:hypothetical protein
VFVVRFVALAALAIWIGGMLAPFWLTSSVASNLGPQTRLLGYVCGALVLVSLFVIKFMGPPPSRFPLRASIVAVMLLILIYTDVMRVTSAAPTAVNVVLALVLLSWYAHE